MKKRRFFILAICLLSMTTYAQDWKTANWPVLKHYDGNHLYRIALPIGGIGTGTVSLGGRGELRDWEIMNIPGKTFHTTEKGNGAPFFAIYTKGKNCHAQATMLAGPIYPYEYMHCMGQPVDNYGLPRFANASFDAAYPFGQVNLSDNNLPVTVRVKGFNPLVPTNADESSLPVAVLSYEVTNTTDSPLEVAVCGSIRNFIGKDGSNYYMDWNDDIIPKGAKDNENKYREDGKIKGIYYFSNGVAKDDPAWGTFALTTTSDGEVSYRTSGREDGGWWNALLEFWDDFSDNGVITEKFYKQDVDPMGSLSVKKTLAAHETQTFTFYLTWDFPNRKAWSPKVVGNYYSKFYNDAWDAAQKMIPTLPELEKKTLTFVNAFLSSSYPDEVKEAALFNISTLRSQTVFRIPSGQLMGWEGTMERLGSCEGSCTHVWNYETTTPFLFGELAKTMRDVEFNYSLRDKGFMNFRAFLPLNNNGRNFDAAADGQMGCIMKFYREWQLCGDNSFLKNDWDKVKEALSYAWVDKGWDGNQDGVMEGSQHNTMDVNYFGPNPQMQFWYMGALRAAEEMAKAMKDKAFEKKCHELFVKGSTWMDANLFNGEYYEQKITDPKTFEFLDMDNPKVKIPDFQLGKGCLVDQLVGQYMASICGLGYLANPTHIRTTLKSIMKYNYLPDFSRHFNNMRNYVMGNEAGLLMASWPKGRLDVPFPYWAESMTGFEYTAAVGMLYEGMKEDGLKCIRAIRNRFDGEKRNPFDEIECGHHYARAMAAWSSVLALSDFHYSGVTKTMSFTSKPGLYFWSNGYAWGMCEITSLQVKLSVLCGKLDINKLMLDGINKTISKNIKMKEGDSLIFKY
jgi:uncharacterized protein (DUF608 family)